MKHPKLKTICQHCYVEVETVLYFITTVVLYEPTRQPGCQLTNRLLSDSQSSTEKKAVLPADLAARADEEDKITKL